MCRHLCRSHSWQTNVEESVGQMWAGSVLYHKHLGRRVAGVNIFARWWWWWWWCVQGTEASGTLLTWRSNTVTEEEIFRFFTSLNKPGRCPLSCEAETLKHKHLRVNLDFQDKALKTTSWSAGGGATRAPAFTNVKLRPWLPSTDWSLWMSLDRTQRDKHKPVSLFGFYFFWTFSKNTAETSKAVYKS